MEEANTDESKKEFGRNLYFELLSITCSDDGGDAEDARLYGEWYRQIQDLIGLLDPISLLYVLEAAEVHKLSHAGFRRAIARHSKPEGSWSKQEAIRMAWASGKYTSRAICAEQECAALGMSFDTARKALRNTPKPP